MRLILPFPPSVNGYWRSTRKGVLISERGRIFRSNALAAIYQQLRSRPTALLTELDVHLVLFPPSRAKRDLDNFQKALFDGLTHAGIWKDDSQVKRMTVEWGEVTKGGKAEITITDFKAAGVQPV
ncbi:RusA family crossover junction endodeoxyribonuclease [Rahnella aceris]|jgi:crossover junction endodeoxyribonuclease RusA|uniref:RusA family crossover junction endodeoxyribonuclease n=1 Tax=Rahnella sp. (strain Y9602) TaxID=2703885 RepID=UPI0014237BA6|nr:RusA family crossover junction endodeoxyribonuclease [Rahnella aceris]MBU9866203.1 RusA family crossover junction endodeoxyribonuclease [Rahnella aceris]NIA89966.1 RusA family crossover junction endodeoxyribonuclease [Rahnella aceris]